MNLVVKLLKKQGLTINKNYDKVKKSEKELANSQQLNQIYVLLEKVQHYEEALSTQPNS